MGNYGVNGELWGQTLSIDKRANSINVPGISIRGDIRQFLFKRIPIYLLALSRCQDYYEKLLKNAKKKIKQGFIIEVNGFP